MAKYSKDEKVLCQHGLCTYPAKILDVEADDDGTFKYLVHYQGWNPKWDEWIQDDRMDKFTEEKAKAVSEENRKILERAKKKGRSGGGGGSRASKATNESDRASMASAEPPLEKLGSSRASSPSANSVISSSTAGGGESVTSSAAKTTSKRARRSEAPSSSSSVNVATDSKKKRARQSEVPAASSAGLAASLAMSAATAASVQSEQDYLNKPEVSIKIPEELRPLLVDDWDLVIKQMKLVSLPAKPTVAQIFEDYIQEKKNTRNMSPAKLSSIVESAEGLSAYFDVMLPSQLLYKFEKAQYDELFQRNQDMVASEFYGFAHLLRLFVRLGYMLACTGMDERNTALVLAHVADFLKFLKKVKPSNMAGQYEIASPEYQRMAFS